MELVAVRTTAVSHLHPSFTFSLPDDRPCTVRTTRQAVGGRLSIFRETIQTAEGRSSSKQVCSDYKTQTHPSVRCVVSMCRLDVSFRCVVWMCRFGCLVRSFDVPFRCVVSRENAVVMNVLVFTDRRAVSSTIHHEPHHGTAWHCILIVLDSITLASHRTPPSKQR